jgi:hypothetical protein
MVTIIPDAYRAEIVWEVSLTIYLIVKGVQAGTSAPN